MFDSRAMRYAEWFCIAILVLGFIWLVVQVATVAFADMSAADVWRKP